MHWDEARVTTTDEQFSGRTIVNVSYDGLYIGMVSQEGTHWEDAHGHHYRTREKAIHAVVKQCQYHTPDGNAPTR